MIKIFGLKTCNACRDVEKWIKEHGLEYEFFDLRYDKISSNLIQFWIGQVGWELLLNRRSITWRKFSKQETQDIGSDLAMKLMLANPTVIKRPVVEYKGQVYVGLKTEQMVAIID